MKWEKTAALPAPDISARCSGTKRSLNAAASLAPLGALASSSNSSSSSSCSSSLTSHGSEHGRSCSDLNIPGGSPLAPSLRDPSPPSPPPLYLVLVHVDCGKQSSQNTRKRVLQRQKPDEVHQSDSFGIINHQLSSNFSLHFLSPRCLSLSQVYIPCRTAIVLANEEIDYCY